MVSHSDPGEISGSDKAGRGGALNSQVPSSRNSTADFFLRAISVLTLALAVWISLITAIGEGANADEEKIPILIFLFAVALAAIFFPKPLIAKAVDWLRLRKRALPVAACVLFALGISARFGFMVFTYVPASDPAQFFENATSLLKSGVLKYPSYVGLFPHLYAYDALLAGMFHITGSGLLGVIILNTAFDALAAFEVGHLVYLLTGSRKWRLVTSVFWWISPFNIIFCAISLPVIVVNALILAGLVLLVYLFKSAENLKRVLVFSVAASAALAAEDAFRPVVIITILAIVVYYAAYLLKECNPKRLRNCVLSVMILAVLYGASVYGWQQAVNAATGLPFNTNKQGWSIYVGSNYETGGTWNRQDDDYLMSVVQSYNGDFSKAFGEMQREGILRWKLLGPGKAMQLVVRKTIHLTGDNQHMIYNLWGSYPYWTNHFGQYQAMCVLCAIYWFVMLAGAVYLFFRRRREKKLDFIGFLSILTIGYFLAFMAVEVANRYFTIFFPMFTVFATIGLKNALDAWRSAPLSGSRA